MNAYDGNGGAGQAMMRLHHALKREGVHSEALCMYRFHSGTDVTPIYRNGLGKLRSIAAIFSERYLVKALTPNQGIPFSLQWFGLPVHRHPLVRRADILHLHWVNHGMLSPRQLEKLFALKKPVVWTLHDSNPLTGGCHVRYDCIRYEDRCGMCPALDSRRENDWSRRAWNAKAKAVRAAQPGQLTWVAPSRWMGGSARKAGLNPGQPVEVIGNALETEVFYARDRSKCRQELGIPPDSFVLLAGHMPSSTDRHKGAAELRQAIARLRAFPEVDHSRIRLVFFGSRQGDGEAWPYPCHFAGKISQDELLAAYYSAADIFLFPSLQESLGYTALESLACGTPVVAFETSGVTDVVRHQENGYLAETGNALDFAEGIKWVYGHPDRAELGAQGIAHAAAHYDSHVVAAKHLNLYKQLLSR